MSFENLNQGAKKDNRTPKEKLDDTIKGVLNNVSKRDLNGESDKYTSLSSRLTSGEKLELVQSADKLKLLDEIDENSALASDDKVLNYLFNKKKKAQS